MILKKEKPMTLIEGGNSRDRGTEDFEDSMLVSIMSESLRPFLAFFSYSFDSGSVTVCMLLQFVGR